MGTTANRAYPYPASTDDVRPHEDIEALADAVDADVDAALKKPIGRIVASGTQSLSDNAVSAIVFSGTDVIDTHGQHNPASNNTRVTPNLAGYYRARGVVMNGSRNDWIDVNAWIRTNGTDSHAGGTRNGFHGITTASIQSALAEAIVACNGSTDYFELVAQSNNNSGVAQITNQSSQFSSVLEWEWLRPL